MMNRQPCPECEAIMKYCFPSPVRDDLQELASQFQRCDNCNWRGNIADNLQYERLVWSRSTETLYTDYGNFESIESFLTHYRD